MMRWMRLLRCGFTRTEIVLTAVMCFILAAVLYPVFAQPETRPYAKVVDGDGRPIPGAVLRFRDFNGSVAAVLTMNENGVARRRDLKRLARQHSVDDYVFIRYFHSTGGSGRYLFSRVGAQEVVFRDSSGRPLTNLPVTFFHDLRTWWTHNSPNGPQDAVTDESGRVYIEDVPLPARFTFRSRDKRYAVRDVQVNVRRDSVRYDVTLAL